jgi:hypothetical protein
MKQCRLTTSKSAAGGGRSLISPTRGGRRPASCICMLGGSIGKVQRHDRLVEHPSLSVARALAGLGTKVRLAADKTYAVDYGKD